MTGNTKVGALWAVGHKNGHVLFQWHSDIVSIPTMLTDQGSGFAHEVALLADLTLASR